MENKLLGVKERMAEGGKKGPCGGGTWYLDCIDVNILIAITVW